jgi:agmatinase
MSFSYSAFAISCLFQLIAAREISFPPVAGLLQQAVFFQANIDVTTGPAFAGLTTYANLPYVQCLAADGVEVAKYDIAILGAPFDTVSWFFLIRILVLRRKALLELMYSWSI